MMSNAKKVSIPMLTLIGLKSYSFKKDAIPLFQSFKRLKRLQLSFHEITLETGISL